MDWKTHLGEHLHSIQSRQIATFDHQLNTIVRDSVYSASAKIMIIIHTQLISSKIIDYCSDITNPQSTGRSVYWNKQKYTNILVYKRPKQKTLENTY